MGTPPKPQPTITSKNVPQPAPPVNTSSIPAPSGIRPPVQVVDESGQLPVYDGPTIVARPLGDPDMANLRPKNPMHVLYWANRGYQNGFRVNYRIAQKFRLARKEDVENLPLDEDGKCFMIDPTGAIVDGDRVLMIIGRNAYEGALLHNHNSAIRRGHKFGQVHQNWRENSDGSLTPVDKPTDAVRATVDEVRGSPLNKSKISSFVPTPAELESLNRDDKQVKP